jgi:ATP synthase I chain
VKQSSLSVDIDYDKATRRLFWVTGVIGLTGALSSWSIWGRAAGGGFAIGSVASLANVWIWHTIAQRLSANEGKPSKLTSVLLTGRFLALFAIAYVILRTLKVQPVAVIAGLLTSALAVIAEILVELAAILLRLPK